MYENVACLHDNLMYANVARISIVNLHKVRTERENFGGNKIYVSSTFLAVDFVTFLLRRTSLASHRRAPRTTRTRCRYVNGKANPAIMVVVQGVDSVNLRCMRTYQHRRFTGKILT
jgi:hypothetical protein